MQCPYCRADKDSLKVIDSRSCDGGVAIRRRRECLLCQNRFTTYERIEQPTRLVVIKRDGERVPFDRAKILAGLERACYKLAVPQEELNRIVVEVEEELYRRLDKEVPSQLIGQLVSDRLRTLNQVAYVRFASVYRRFSTLEDVVAEAQAVIDARRFEDPRQGRLFVDDRSPEAAADAPATGSTVSRKRRGAQKP